MSADCSRENETPDDGGVQGSESSCAGFAGSPLSPPSNTGTQEDGAASSQYKQCTAIDSVDDVLSWSADSWRQRHGVASLLSPVCRHALRRGGMGRTLVCHDMQGGYLDDRFCAGWMSADGEVTSGGGLQYVFHHWQLVDEFVYFSHRLITVPPCGWIQTAHLHGVSVYGTLITEGVEGRTVCERLLSSRQLITLFIDRLVELSVTCGIDGWLVNIENSVASREMAAELLWLVQNLTSSMHKRLPASRIIWYDSVTSDNGELSWQNELNHRNVEFFNVCDGIYLNYCWTEDGLQRSVARAGVERAADVYVGVDVFGRGCPGGGGFNSHEALRVIATATSPNRLLSIAIFGHGWTHEVLGECHFLSNERRFWRLLECWLPTRFGPREWPLITDFCLGRGHNLYRVGCISRYGAWFCPGLQSLQPSHLFVQYSDSSVSPATNTASDCGQDIVCQVSHFTEECYSGGSCLLVENHSVLTRTLPLFECSLEFHADKSLAVVFAVKSSENSPNHSSALSGIALLIEVFSSHTRSTERLVFCGGKSDLWRSALSDPEVICYWQSDSCGRSSTPWTIYDPVSADVFSSCVTHCDALTGKLGQLQPECEWSVYRFIVAANPVRRNEHLQLRHVGIISSGLSSVLLGLVMIDHF